MFVRRARGRTSWASRDSMVRTGSCGTGPEAFQRVTCRIPERMDLCRFGTLGYQVLDSPGQRRIDFGLFKNFRLTETFNLQFRSEYYNALNTTVLPSNLPGCRIPLRM